MGLTKLEKIEQAVLELTEEEQAKFRQWFAEFDARVFDEKLERDAKSGKFDERAKRARAAHKAGLTREI
jgi:hypothetical protein